MEARPQITALPLPTVAAMAPISSTKAPVGITAADMAAAVPPALLLPLFVPQLQPELEPQDQLPFASAAHDSTHPSRTSQARVLGGIEDRMATREPPAKRRRQTSTRAIDGFTVFRMCVLSVVVLRHAFANLLTLITTPNTASLVLVRVLKSQRCNHHLTTNDFQFY
jgi:hypothetical protein